MELDDKIALLYARVSTSMQVQDGVSLDVQERTLRQAAELAGYKNVQLVREEGRSGKSIKGRPALRGALADLQSGKAHALFVTRLDRLSRSTQDFLSIIDHSKTHNWRLVLLDLNLDTSSYQSRFVVTIMSALAEMERSIISEKAAGVSMNGIARKLNAENIPAAYGGKWSASSIKYVLDQKSEELK
jgi:site-specific DNA recombinase